ncbi:MAG: esterase [Acidimicrobiia bacterium]|nr:esterase [Acidimicrobiia bacterium]
MSLVDGFFPWLIAIAAFTLTAVAIAGRPGRFYARQLPITVAGASIIAAVAVLVVHRVHGLIADPTDEYPFTVNVLATLALVNLAVAAWTWRQTRGWQRGVGIVAAVAMAMLAGDRLAIRYGYPRDVRALLGLEVPGAKKFEATAFAPEPSPPGTEAVSESLAPSPTTGAPNAATSVTPGSPTAFSTSWHAPANLPRQGELLHDVPIPGSKSGFNARKAYVYLPPAFFAQPRPRLPVVILLSGVPGQPKNWLDGLSTHKVYDQFAAGHEGLAPILVFPDYTGGFTSDRGCVDSGNINVETYLAVDVPAFVAHTFEPAAGPSSWGIGGFSDGGTCALMVGLRHPDIFGPILDFSGDAGPTMNGSRKDYVNQFLGGDDTRYAEHDPQALLAGRHFPATTALWLEAGDQEPRKKAATVAIADAARADAITVNLVTKPGQHNFDFWRTCVVDSALWIDQRLNLVP